MGPSGIWVFLHCRNCGSCVSLSQLTLHCVFSYVYINMSTLEPDCVVHLTFHCVFLLFVTHTIREYEGSRSYKVYQIYVI